MADHHELEPLRLRDFTAEQFELSIGILAVCGGNTEEAARVLNDQDIPVSGRLLRHWKHDYPVRYQQACRHFAEQIEDHLLARQREVALTAADKAMLTMERVTEDTPSKELSVLATAAKAFAVTSGVGTDKTLLMQGKPTQIFGPANLDEILKARKREYSNFVDTTCEELPSSPALAVPGESQPKVA
jgi:hypothetical protein